MGGWGMTLSIPLFLQRELARKHEFTMWGEHVTHAKPPSRTSGTKEEPYNNSVCPRGSAVAQVRLSLDSEQLLPQMESIRKT